MVFAQSKICLKSVISSVLPELVKASMGIMRDLLSIPGDSPTNNTWLLDRSKERLIWITASSMHPEIEFDFKLSRYVLKVLCYAVSTGF